MHWCISAFMEIYRRSGVTERGFSFDVGPLNFLQYLVAKIAQ